MNPPTGTAPVIVNGGTNTTYERANAMLFSGAYGFAQSYGADDTWTHEVSMSQPDAVAGLDLESNHGIYFSCNAGNCGNFVGSEVAGTDASRAGIPTQVGGTRTAFTVILGTAPVEATGTVAATVSPESISVTVADGVVSYGVLNNEQSRSTAPSDLNDTQTITNSGTVAEDFSIKGRDSEDWTLAATNGVNQYVHRFCTSSCNSPATNYAALSTDYQDLASGVAPRGHANLDLQITAPIASTAVGQQTVDVTIMATAN